MNTSSFHVEHVDGATVLRVTATKLRDRPVIMQLQEDLVEFLDEHAPEKCVIAFGGVEFLSSEAINALLAARDHAIGRGTHLKLADLSHAIDAVLKIVGLDQLFEIHPTVAEAIGAF